MRNANLEVLSELERRHEVLDHAVALVLLFFGKDIRSIYLVGSQVDESFSKNSDLDLVIIAAPTIDRASFATFERCLNHLSVIVLDLKLYVINDLQNRTVTVDPCIHYKSRLLFGAPCLEEIKISLGEYLNFTIERVRLLLRPHLLTSSTSAAPDCSQVAFCIPAKRLVSLVTKVCRVVVAHKRGLVTNTKLESAQNLLICMMVGYGIMCDALFR